jgi:DsbE subfamily thiol:disulfide oxidoreductase
MKNKIIILLISFLIIFLLADSVKGFKRVTIGSEAPDFLLKDITGKKVSLSSFKGKPVLLNFWTTWCPYCRKERPHLNKLHRQYKDRGLVIISVSTNESVEKVINYLKRIPADFLVLTDVDGKVAAAYNVGGFPTSFLINRNGIIKYKFLGFREWTSIGLKKIVDNFINN